MEDTELIILEAERRRTFSYAETSFPEWELQGLAKRVRRILRVNDFHIPVADAARDLDIDAAEAVDDASTNKGSDLQKL